MQTKEVTYNLSKDTFSGYLAWNENKKEPRPAVLVVHDWSGRNEFAMQKAKALTDLGYVGFAVDMYGKGKTGQTIEEKQSLMMPLMEDRALLSARINSALHQVASFSCVDSQKIAVMGYCFGGLCALDLARSGADVKGAVSFHGLLTPPSQTICKKTKAKVLVLHGYDDPMVPPKQVNAFQQEMTEKKVDWQVQIYGHTMHAFTNPEAKDASFGTVYNKKAAIRSWQATIQFLADVLS